MKIEELIQVKQKLFDKSQEISKSKGHDYSNADPNLDTFKNIRVAEQFGLKAEQGVLIRLMDKIMRLSNYIQTNDFQVKDESLQDTIIDAINYLTYIYALQVERKCVAPIVSTT